MSKFVQPVIRFIPGNNGLSIRLDGSISSVKNSADKFYVGGIFAYSLKPLLLFEFIDAERYLIH